MDSFNININFYPDKHLVLSMNDSEILIYIENYIRNQKNQKDQKDQKDNIS